MASEIVFNLSELTVPTALPPHAFFYQEELDKVNIKLENFTRLARDHRREYGDRLAGKMYYNAISVVGNRGAGKTTFLKTLGGFYSLTRKRRVKLPNVRIMKIIDPTVLESTEIFLSIVLSAIWSETEEYIKESRRYADLREWSERRDRDQDEPREWIAYRERNGEELVKRMEEARFDLARRFKALLDGSFSEQWKDKDPEFLAMEMTSLSRDGLFLPDVFHRFLHRVTELLGVDLLVLPIDDCDTLFGRSLDVLETVRKYFRSPYLVPIITGDLNLFETAILNHYYKEAHYIPKDVPEYQNLPNQLSRLSGQYLTKVLNPHNHIVLHPIVDHWNGLHSPRPCLIQTGDEEPKAMSAFFVQFLRKAFLMPFPYRDERILQRKTNPYARLLPRNNRLLINILQGMEYFLNAPERMSYGDVLKPLLDVYWFYTHHFGLSTDLLMRFYAHDGENLLTHKMLTQWEVNHTFFSSVSAYTESRNEVRQRNIVAILLSMIFSRAYRENPFRILHFMLLPCGITHAINRGQLSLDKVPLLELDQNHTLIEHMMLFGEVVRPIENPPCDSTGEYDRGDGLYDIQEAHDGQWFANIYKFLAVAGELAVFLSRTQPGHLSPVHYSSEKRSVEEMTMKTIHSSSIDVSKEELAVYLEEISEYLLSESEVDRVASHLRAWSHCVKALGMATHYRPVSRILALAMIRFRKQAVGIRQRKMWLRDMIHCFCDSVFKEEESVLQEPENKDWYTLYRNGFENVKLLTLTGFLATHPILRLALYPDDESPVEKLYDVSGRGF